MDGIEGQVEEERFVRILLLDQPAGFLGDEMRGITLVVAGFVILVPVEFPLTHVREIIDVASPETILVIKPATGGQIGWLVTQMPLSHDGGLVTGFFQSLRQSPFLQRQAPGHIRPHHIVDARVARIAACQERRARSRTQRLGIK